MAQKNPSRAERAVTDAKKKVPAVQTSAKTKKTGSDRKSVSKKKATVKTEYEHTKIPNNAVTALVSITLFGLFLIICINPEGALLRILHSFVLGMVGQAGFYFSIPALLYIFIIHAFARRIQTVRMRTICVILFVFSCGVIFHLSVQNQGMAEGFALVSDLYSGGMDGRSGGIICGGAALLLRWACGNVLSFIISILLAAISLLGAMQITIPSIIRAIANRPRDDFEDDESAYIEPAAVVVNHIANKNIEKRRQNRQRVAAEKANGEIFALEEEKLNTEPKRLPTKIEKIAHKEECPTNREEEIATIGTPARAGNVMNTIDLDINAPVLSLFIIIKS